MFEINVCSVFLSVYVSVFLVDHLVLILIVSFLAQRIVLLLSFVMFLLQINWRDNVEIEMGVPLLLLSNV